MILYTKRAESIGKILNKSLVASINESISEVFSDILLNIRTITAYNYQKQSISKFEYQIQKDEKKGLKYSILGGCCKSKLYYMH